MEGILFQLLSKLGEVSGREQGITLTPGELISVYVKQVTGNQALLRYQSGLFLAQLEANIQEGTRVNCQVQTDSDGRILLKLVDSGNPIPRNSELVTGLLKEAGFPPTELNKALVNSMIKQGAALSQDSLTTVIVAAQRMNIRQTDVDSLVFMHQRGLPLNEANLGVFTNSPAQTESLGQQLASLRTMLINYKNNVAPVRDGASRIPEQLNNIVDRLLVLLEKVSLRAGDKDLVAALRLSLARSNLTQQVVSPQSGQMEHNSPPRAEPSLTGSLLSQPVLSQPVLSKPVISKPFVSGPATGQSDGRLNDNKASTEGYRPDVVEAKDAGAKNFGDQLLPRLIKLVETVNSPIKAKFMAALAEVVDAEQNILKSDMGDRLPELLKKLHEIIKHEESPILKEMATKATVLADRLNIYHQVNKGIEQGQDSVFLFQSLANPDNPRGGYEVLVRLKKESGQTQFNYSDCRVVVSLNTLSLGLIKAQLKVQSKDLTCQLFVENDDFLKVVEAKVDTLEERLRKCGFQVTMLPIEVAQIYESSLTGLIDTDHDAPMLNGLNILV